MGDKDYDAFGTDRILMRNGRFRGEADLQGQWFTGFGRIRPN
jgi:hypothetical protein